MIWTSPRAASAAQSSSEEGLQDNLVEKQIEEANQLIERVMTALREIKVGITQYKAYPGTPVRDSTCLPCRPGFNKPTPTVRTTTRVCRSKPPAVPRARCRTPPRTVPKEPPCISVYMPPPRVSPKQPSCIPVCTPSITVPKPSPCIPVCTPSITVPKPSPCIPVCTPSITVPKPSPCIPVCTPSVPPPKTAPKPCTCIPVCMPSPKIAPRPPPCTPVCTPRDEPIAKAEVHSEVCPFYDFRSRTPKGREPCDRYTCKKMSVEPLSEKKLKGEKPLVDEETGIDKERPKTRRGSCRPCGGADADQVEVLADVTDEPTHSLEMLKAKLSMISEPSDTMSDHSGKKADEVQDSKDKLPKAVEERTSKLTTTCSSLKRVQILGPQYQALTDTADKLKQKCLKCLKSGAPAKNCICAKVLSELSASHQIPVSNIKSSSCHGCKKLQVQNIPPVSIKGGLVVQKVLELAIKPSGSTDVMFNRTDNIGYEEVMENGSSKEASKTVSFIGFGPDLAYRLSLNEIANRALGEIRSINFSESLETDFPGSLSSHDSAKLNVLQSYQVLNIGSFTRSPSDTPDMSYISGSINMDVYKTYIDPNAELTSITDEEDPKPVDVQLTRIRKASIKSGSSVPKLKRSAEGMKSHEAKPVGKIDSSRMTEDKEIVVNVHDLERMTRDLDKLTKEPLETIAEAGKECQDVQPSDFGHRDPFEIGLYENKAIQCGPSYIHTAPKGRVTVTSETVQPVTLHYPKYDTAAVQAEGSSDSSSSITVSSDSFTSEDSGEGVASKGLQVSMSSSTTEDSSSNETSLDADKRSVSYQNSTVKKDETVHDFLTGLTEQTPESIGTFQKSHGNIADKGSAIMSSIASGHDETRDSICTVDMDENAAMLRNLVRDPNKKKIYSSQATPSGPSTPVPSGMLPTFQPTLKFGEKRKSQSSEKRRSQSAENYNRSTTTQYCQVEHNGVDIWKSFRLSEYDMPRNVVNIEEAEASAHRQECHRYQDVQRPSRSPKYNLEHSASDPITLDETLSDSEYRCKCSVSSGEIHVCPFGRDMRNRVKYLKKHPEKFLRKELGDSKLKILAQRRFYNNWVSYYVQMDTSGSSGINTSTSTNSGKNTV